MHWKQIKQYIQVRYHVLLMCAIALFLVANWCLIHNAIPEHLPKEMSPFQRSVELHSASNTLLSSKTCVVTISAWNNYGFVKTLHHTLEETNPNINCFAWVVADIPVPRNHKDREAVAAIRAEAEMMFHVATIDDLMDKLGSSTCYDLYEAAFKFSLVEFSTTIKPYAIMYS